MPQPLQITAVNHVGRITRRVEESRNFYRDVLGFREVERPNFDFPGAWLYSGDAPVVHLVARDTGRDASAGAVDHVAFRARDLAGVVARLRERGVAYELRSLPGRGTHQLFVHDPDGVKIELDFAADEPLPEGA